MQLSSLFLGAVSLLQWACSRARPLSSLGIPPSDAFSHMAQFPVTLVLVKPGESSVAGVGSSLKARTGTPEYTGTPEQMDWGPLVTHCYSVYWKCLSYYLKWSCDPTAVSHDPSVPTRPLAASGYPAARATKDERISVGSSVDITAVVDGCIDGLDKAAGCAGVIIESVASTIPKVL